MTYRYDGYNYLLRLEKGELLMETLATFAQDKKLKATWISGLGGALWAELGAYNLDKKQYEFKRIEDKLEVTALQGNISWFDDKPLVHIHATLSKLDLTAIGGHLKELCVGATCELFLHTIYTDEQLSRLRDENIGLPLLDL